MQLLSGSLLRPSSLVAGGLMWNLTNSSATSDRGESHPDSDVGKKCDIDGEDGDLAERAMDGNNSVIVEDQVSHKKNPKIHKAQLPAISFSFRGSKSVRL
jgi:hypothetical protein